MKMKYLLWSGVRYTHANHYFTEYLVLEQVCIAAADVNRIDIVDDCLRELNVEFPGSLRVKRLQVLKLEMAGK